MVILGNMLYALTLKLFLLPTSLMTGGGTGIALALNHATGFSISLFVLIFNIGMLLLGFLFIGKAFALSTVVSTFAYPICLELFNRLLGDIVLTDDILLCTLFSGLGIGVALSMVLRAGASTGGMDIPPILLNKYFRIPVSASLYVFDCCILLLQAYSAPIEMLLYSVLLVMIYSLVLDKLLLIGSARTEVKVISKHSDEIRNAILTRLDRGVTMLSAEGGYLKNPEQIVLSVISNRELPKLEKLIHEIDPESFMIVSRVTEVKGRGFSLNKKYQ